MHMDADRQTKTAVQLAALISMLSIGSLMMIMPLGPDFVRELDMPADRIGYLAGAATLAAALGSALSAAWLDRFERKPVLLALLVLRFALLGACAGASDAHQLTWLFVLSAFVAGPLGAVLMASLLDLIPPAERGRQLARLAMGFSLAAILVTPLALELARWLGWRAPMLGIAAVGLALAFGCHILFPSPQPHPRPPGALRPLLRSPLCLGALALVALQMFSHFLLVPHFSAFFQFNLGFAREHIGVLYLCGGLASLAAVRLGGSWIDRGHARRLVLSSSGLLALITLLGFALLVPLPLLLVFSLFMALSTLRTSSTTTVAASIPAPHQRAAFMALHGSVSNVAAGLGSLASAAYLGTAADGELTGFEHLAGFHVVLTLTAGAALLLLLAALRRHGHLPTPTTTSRA